MRLISAGSLVRAQSGPLVKVREGEAPSSAREARALPIRFTDEPRVKQNAGCRSYRSYIRRFVRFSHTRSCVGAVGKGSYSTSVNAREQVPPNTQLTHP